MGRSNIILHIAVIRLLPIRHGMGTATQLKLGEGGGTGRNVAVSSLCRTEDVGAGSFVTLLIYLYDYFP